MPRELPLRWGGGRVARATAEDAVAAPAPLQGALWSGIVPSHLTSALGFLAWSKGHMWQPEGVRVVHWRRTRPRPFWARKLCQVHRAGPRQGVEHRGGSPVMSADGLPLYSDVLIWEGPGAGLGRMY